MARLENWSLIFTTQNFYLAPEVRSKSIHGEIYDHSYFKNGDKIKTSPITSAKGNKIITQTGTLYTLGTPSKKYIKWLNENQIPFDPNNPFPFV